MFTKNKEAKEEIKEEVIEEVQEDKNEEDSEIVLTHAVILEGHPHYVLAHNEKSAIEVAERYRHNCLGIIVAPKGLQVKSLKTQITLGDMEVKRIGQFVETSDGVFEEVEDIEEDFYEDDIHDLTKPLED